MTVKELLDAMVRLSWAGYGSKEVVIGPDPIEGTEGRRNIGKVMLHMEREGEFNPPIVIVLGDEHAPAQLRTGAT